jgi:hypothetical protein
MFGIVNENVNEYARSNRQTQDRGVTARGGDGEDGHDSEGE